MNLSNTLFVKIFLAFWLLIILMLGAVILLPHLDTRLVQPITSPDKRLIEIERENIQKTVSSNEDLDIFAVLDILNQDRYREYYLTDYTGHLINLEAPYKMRQFMLDSDSTDKIFKQINTEKTYFGPVLLIHKNEEYKLYTSIPNRKKTLVLLEWLLDNPILLMLTVIMVSMPLCALFAWRLTRPIRDLSLVANKVAHGELEVEFPEVDTTEEIKSLGNSMQYMVQSVKNTVTNQQRLLSDISHELRSPLTRLSLAAAILKKRSGKAPELDRIDVEIDRMEKMIAEMLDVSRVQINSTNKEEIPLKEFLEDLFLDADFEAKESGKMFTYPDLSNVEISVYPELAYRAIENIIRNAIKYSKLEIIADVIEAEKHILITITNDGPLIPDSDIDNIFRPFYRLAESRERETGGAGLGLSIAENAMVKHGGKIWADNDNGFVSMHLQFPRGAL